MCFSAGVVKRFGWRWHSLVEDLEAHAALVCAGVRVDFAPETRVLAEMPTTFSQAIGQNTRWERGRLQIAVRWAPRLLRAALARRSPIPLDAALELLVPPLSVCLALTAASLAGALARRSAVLALVSGVSLVSQAAYVVAALALVRASRQTYLALVRAPVYVAWKFGVYVRALLVPGTVPWARIARGGAANDPGHHSGI
jgi:hypothetical protein